MKAEEIKIGERYRFKHNYNGTEKFYTVTGKIASMEYWDAVDDNGQKGWVLSKELSPIDAVYFDLNVQVWSEDGQHYYSVIQEFREDGKDQEVLGYGSEDSLETALKIAKDLVDKALS